MDNGSHGSAAKQCPRCGSGLPPDLPGCPTCGWGPNDPPPPWMFCPACGFEIRAPTANCPSCWNRLDGNEPVPRDGRIIVPTPENHFLAILLVVAAAFAGAYHYVHSGGMSQTYAAFIGLPLLVGLLTTYLSRSRNGWLNTLKVTTVILCVVAPLMGEGAICILMAAPIFYAVALVGYGIIAGIASIGKPRGPGRLRVALLLPLIPLSCGRLTATPNGLVQQHTMTVTSDVQVAATPDRVWDVLLHGELVSARFPVFLRLGFPLPKRMERLPGGETRITFDPGSEHWPGTNVIVSRQDADAEHRRITFTIVDDGTKLKRWLLFQSTTLEVTPAEGGSTVTQTTVFRQRMQPGIYWNPLESFAMGQMHSYLLGHIAELAEKKP